MADALLGAWQASAIWSVQTGYRYTPQTGNDTCNCEDGNAESLRPDAVPGQNPNSGPHTPAQCFNANAFNVNVPNGRSGNAGRNTILGPGFIDLDFGAHKEFQIGESKRLEFRADPCGTLRAADRRAQLRRPRYGAEHRPPISISPVTEISRQSCEIVH